MTIANTTRYRSGRGSRPAVNSSISAASGGEIMIADPTEGYKIAIEHLSISCGADEVVSLREDTAIVPFFGPLVFKIAGPFMWQHQFMKIDGQGALLLTANKELQVITTGSSAVHIYCEYHILKEA